MSAKALKLLHVIDGLTRGGAETLLVSIINNLPEHEHHLICLSDNAPLEVDLPAYCHFTKLGFKKKTDTIRLVKFIRNYISVHKIEIVHSHLVMANIISRLATPRHIPLFNSLHNLNGKKIFKSPLSWQRLAEKLTYKKRHNIIAVSQAVLDDYNHYIGVKGSAIVLYNFVDDRFFANEPQIKKIGNTLRLVAVGNLKEQKNYGFLINAFKGLPKNITLDIYGDGPLKPEIAKLIEESGAPITLKGIRRDIQNVLPEYDLYVMSSHFEGHPIALLEAMACGMPALVSDIPVLREATGGTGLFFTLADTNEFTNSVNAILAGKIDLSAYAVHNLKHANDVARKSNYLRTIIEIYRSSKN
jgi:glycosyltransferase involved in cell wall biosynthesis